MRWSPAILAFIAALAMARPAAARAQAGDMMIRAGTPPVVRATFVC